ncbi:unnamed protein product [Schistocephalus solidus]|uniref:EGF-like domain-containing protein n=1 Tax=Schistocephalus solidus TaxID=70667 RepID=A0A183TRH5_SCHSO|nr:unnamed protein product [Schistocephalus solidus]
MLLLDFSSVININECNQGLHRCQEHELCVNLPGYFRCQSVCPKGYRLAGELAGGVPNCVDIDECQVPEGGKRACPEGATCTNVPGSFRCQCADGRPPVGNTCQEAQKRLLPNHVASKLARIGYHSLMPVTYQYCDVSNETARTVFLDFTRRFLLSNPAICDFS